MMTVEPVTVSGSYKNTDGTYSRCWVNNGLVYTSKTKTLAQEKAEIKEILLFLEAKEKYSIDNGLDLWIPYFIDSDPDLFWGLEDSDWKQLLIKKGYLKEIPLEQLIEEEQLKIDEQLKIHDQLELEKKELESRILANLNRLNCLNCVIQIEGDIVKISQRSTKNPRWFPTGKWNLSQVVAFLETQEKPNQNEEGWIFSYLPDEI